MPLSTKLVQRPAGLPVRAPARRPHTAAAVLAQERAEMLGWPRWRRRPCPPAHWSRTTVTTTDGGLVSPSSARFCAGTSMPVLLPNQDDGVERGLHDPAPLAGCRAGTPVRRLTRAELIARSRASRLIAVSYTHLTLPTI